MSGGVTATSVLAGVAAAGTAYSIYSGEKARKVQGQAQQQATITAQKQASEADQAMNRANQKKPDLGAILGGARMAGAAGPSSTMLTGPQGIDPTALQLAKNTLLGG